MILPGHLIILFGLPRSGTSWIGKIFDSHPNTFYLHEPDSEYRISGLSLVPREEEYDSLSGVVEKYVYDVLRIRTPKVAGKLPIFRKDYYDVHHQLIRSGLIYASKISSRFNVRANIPGFVKSRKGDPIHFVWKSIESLGRMPLIAARIPELRGIIVARHPCGHVASVINRPTKGVAFYKASEDYGMFELLLDTPIAVEKGLAMSDLTHSSECERLAWRWLLVMEKAIAETIESSNVRVVRYEDVCDKRLAVTEELFEFCGLEVGERTRTFLEESSKVETNDYFSVYRDPQAAVSRWRKQLSAEEVKQIKGVVAGSRAGDLYEGEF